MPRIASAIVAAVFAVLPVFTAVAADDAPLIELKLALPLRVDELGRSVARVRFVNNSNLHIDRIEVMCEMRIPGGGVFDEGKATAEKIASGTTTWVEVRLETWRLYHGGGPAGSVKCHLSDYYSAELEEMEACIAAGYAGLSEYVRRTDDPGSAPGRHSKLLRMADCADRWLGEPE